MSTKLKARRYSAKEWNDKIMPLVENGTLTEEKSKHNSFLMYGQVFVGTLCDKEGNRFRCTAWRPPGGEMYVDVKMT